MSVWQHRRDMQYPSILYGTDPEERLVGVHLLDRVDEKKGQAVRLYSRAENGRVTTRDDYFSPFVVVSEDGLKALKTGFVGYTVTDLEGDGHYRYLVQFKEFAVARQAAKYLRRAEGERLVYAPASATTQYLMLTGKTLFKGMESDDVRRMQLDIEVATEADRFPDAERDQIIIVSLSGNWTDPDGRPYERVIHLSPDRGYTRRRDAIVLDTEPELLRAVQREIQRHDPDVIEGHNNLAFDLPYIIRRAEIHNIWLALGRDRKQARYWPQTQKFAEREVAFMNVDIAGRSVVDTMFLCMAFDVYKREMPSYTLKGAAKYFGFAREGRVYVPGSKISETWRNDPDRLLEYALDDVRETAAIANHLGSAKFYLTQMVPGTFQEVFLRGTSSTIESLLVRHYLDRGHALPRGEDGSQSAGGYTDIFYRGRLEDIVYADVDSLYPSIMLNYNCVPESDGLGAFRTTLEMLTRMRLDTKAQAKNATDENIKSQLTAREQAFKILINSYYGMMGFRFALFSDISEADRVATTGQELLREMMQHIERYGGTVIECDTDGVLFTMSGATEEEKIEVVKKVSEDMPEGINVSMDGLYRVMISYKKKNYALLDYDGKVKTKGGAFKNRGIEAFGRRYSAQMLRALMDGDVQRMWKIHQRYLKIIINGDWTVDDFKSRKALKVGLDTYDEKIAAGNNRQAQYEVARSLQKKTGKKPEKGDVIEFYVSGNTKSYKVKAFEAAKHIDEWYPGDENKDFYIKKRLRSFSQRWAPFFSKEDFGTIFALEVADRMPDLSNVRILSVPVDKEYDNEVSF